MGSSSTGRVLIAGFGSAGRRHYRNLRHLGYRDFVFLRSGLGTIEDEEIRQYPSAKGIDDALAYGPQIAIVATPSALHLDIALAAAVSGCDLYIEKPLSHDTINVDRLTRAVHDRHLIAMVGCQFRFHPLLIEIRAAITRGHLGRVVGATAEWGEHLPGWHPWEDHRASYSARRDLGGGVLLTLIHPLDYLYWLFGPWKRVQAMVRGVPSLQTPAGEDWADVNVEFTDGVQAHVHLDYVQQPKVHRLTVIGEEGSVLCDFETGQLHWSQMRSEGVVQAAPPGFERNTMFLDAMTHFLACVRDRIEPQVPLADGAAVVRMVLEAKQAAGQPCHG